MAIVQVYGARPRRFTEMFLMLMAVAIGAGSYLLTSLNRTGTVPANLWQQIGILLALAIAAEIVVHLTAPHADPVILPTAVALTGIGLAMIHRLDMTYQLQGHWLSGRRQLIFAIAGLVLATLTLAFLRDHRMLRRWTYTFMVLSIVLLVLPMVPGLGVENYGATVWVSIGGFQFQPSEFAKVTLAVFFAGYLVANRDKLSVGGPRFLGMRLPRLRDLAPIVIVWGIGMAVLVMQKDLGTSLLVFGMFVAMLYVATNRVSWIVIGTLMFTPAVWLAVRAFPHVQQRFVVWLDALDPDVYAREGGSYQVVQGLFGMANGGLLGTGWGRGYPTLTPLAESDFILASLGEELGLTGMLAILMLYLILVERGFRAALGTRDGFGKLLATGLAFSIALQLFVVLGGITRVIPLSGLTAPFLAQGGSSMISAWLMVAIMLRVSDSARRPPAKPQQWRDPLPLDAASTLTRGELS